MRRLLSIVSGVLLLAALPARPGEGDVISTALVLGTNAGEGEMPKVLRPFAGKLRRVFGYERFELVARHRKPVGPGAEGWVVPSPHLFMRIESVRREEGGGFQLQLALYQEKRLLVRTTAELEPESPMFIRGPQTGEGQLILIIVAGELGGRRDQP